MLEIINIVDKLGNRIGTIEKLAAHEQGILHEALSTFIFNSKGELLLQKRAQGKYHSGGLWTNTCCSHARSGEDVLQAATRRLNEEMGIQCLLREVFTFTYQTNFPNGLIEHEFDHVFIGHYDGEIKLDPNEAEDYKWVAETELIAAVKNRPEEFTYWLKEILTGRDIWQFVNL